jgi:glycosyltransferase involved in cell wall biosynthesis
VDAIITNSQASKNDIIRHLGIAEDKIHVIYLAGGRDIHPIHRTEMAAILARYDVEPGFILMIGSLDKRRNLPRLLEAYSRLRQQGEHRPLVVIGRHQHGPDLRPALLEKFGLTGFVHFVGYVAARDLPAFYSAADLFVFPSLYEGFGTPPLEAMACGTPVVCSNTTSLPEVVGDAAILVDPQSVDTIADGMQRVLADPDLRADLRIRGFIRADEFSWERTAQKTLEVYQKVF